jgi:hypothetical protein
MNEQTTSVTQFSNEELSNLLINTTIQRTMLDNNISALVSEIISRQQKAQAIKQHQSEIKLPKLRKINIPPFLSSSIPTVEA